MTTSFDGTVLTKCFETVARCGSEIEALIKTLSDLFLKEVNSKRHVCVIAGEIIKNYRRDDSDWVYTEVACSIPLKANGKGNKRPEMYLGFQISLVGDGINLPSNAQPQPLLHVFLWDCAIDLDEYCMSYPIGDENEIQIIDKKVVVWGDVTSKNWTDRQWTYSLRLTSLNTEGDLQKCVVAPSLALLNGKTISEAIPDGLLGLIYYPEVDQPVV
jgi:hypothetical protein